MRRKIKDINELTPVDTFYNVGGFFEKMYFKRDDLYLPFEDRPKLGGGKVRQTINLFEEFKDRLANYNGVVTYASVNSPQAVIVSRVCKMYGFKSVITFGVNGTTESVITTHKPIRECYELGSELLNVAKIGYNNVLLSRTEEIAKEKNYYIIHFGINIDEAPFSLTESVANQVENIPDELDFLVVPVGSGIQLGAILYGIKKFNKKVGRVIGIQISGYDRSGTIDKIRGHLGATDIPYEQVVDKTYPYSTHLNFLVKGADSFRLNVVYEAKAMFYILEPGNRERLGLKRDSSILYWVVGDNNYLYF